MSSSPHRVANHLIHEKSPYLRQHAWNPVDWHPWGPGAFQKARRENKPIFLSIGYSTCHWCHVMERESFENDRIAEILNTHFVSIKVDREERPDLDRVYMTATQAMTGSGGWPMSVWLTHDLEPFYAGTYFPPEPRHGQPGFPEILQLIHAAWQGRSGEIHAAARRMGDMLRQHLSGSPAPVLMSPDLPGAAVRHFQQTFDAAHGGFGGAPKFPRAVQFPFLLRFFASTGDRHALEMALLTLDRMARGGICDQLGGGFHRYSVDAEWRVPHFEKMLYDNAQLLQSYTEAWQMTRQPIFEATARGIIRYLARDMTSPEGAFYSAEDADSEGVEGTFYVWTEAEVASILDPASARLVAAHFHFEPGGNFEHGRNVLHATGPLSETTARLGMEPQTAKRLLDAAMPRLFEARSKRTRPHLDDKVLAGWNGLMISGLARAGRVFGETAFVARAARAADFILARMRDPSTGGLLHRHRDGESKGAAFLDDDAFVIAGLLDLFEATQETRWLDEAERLIQVQIRELWDDENGGFFFTPRGDATLLTRLKLDEEGAEPSGNSVAALNLIRWARLFPSSDALDRAEKTVRAFSGKLQEFPSLMPLMLVAGLDLQEPARQVVVAGDPEREDTRNLWRELNRLHLPNTTLLRSTPEEGELARRLPFLANMKTVKGQAAAYVCQNFTCQPPITDPAALRQLLSVEAEFPLVAQR